MDNITLKTIFIPLHLFFYFICATPAFSASIAVIRPMSFGEIISGPSGDVIGIDARFGPDEDLAVLTDGSSLVKGGYSGLVRVTSDMSGQTINVTYPDSFLLTADGFPDKIVDGMRFVSKTYAITTMAAEEIDFNIGGRLHIESGLTGNALYSGTMTIDVDVINP